MALVVLLVGWKSLRHRCEPSIDDFVEMIAYAAGLFGTKGMASQALAQGADHVEIGLAEMVGAALLAFVSARGIWRTFNKPPIVRPTSAAVGVASEPPASGQVDRA